VTTVQTNPDWPATPPSGRCPRGATWLVAAVAALLLMVVAPVVIRGGLLADEYIICLRPVHEGGYGSYLHAIWRDTGVVRPARFIELFLISKTCTSVPYGLVILVPLALKFAAGLLLCGLLRDLDLPPPWPEIGTMLWLLEPVGTEAALWPAALHVLLGLVFALAALRLFRKGALAWATLASFGAALSVEQVIFALPLAVWMTTRPEHRHRDTMVAGAIVALVIAAYALWPGHNERQALTLVDRWHNVFAKGRWYVLFPVAGLGLYSGALAFAWAFPFSVVVVLIGALTGARLISAILPEQTAPRSERRWPMRALLSVGMLIVLVNLPLIVTEVGYSARTFTPTWLVLSGAVAAGAAPVPWRRRRLVGALGGTFASFAMLSLALSVSVRLRTDSFNRAAAQWIAERTTDGAVVAVCDVDRTVTTPAPLGAFHLHEFHSTWGSWIEYHTGRVVEIRRSGTRYWGSPCPNLQGADLVISFPELVRELLGTGQTAGARGTLQ
jgi:heme/copper-type cytochrome/quinol oxidase subunit 4